MKERGNGRRIDWRHVSPCMEQGVSTTAGSTIGLLNRFTTHESLKTGYRIICGGSCDQKTDSRTGDGKSDRANGTMMREKLSTISSRQKCTATSFKRRRTVISRVDVAATRVFRTIAFTTCRRQWFIGLYSRAGQKKLTYIKNSDFFHQESEEGYPKHLTSPNTFKVNSLMYRLNKPAQLKNTPGNSPILEPIGPENLQRAIEFVMHSIGAPEAWLTQYLSNLVRRRELFGCYSGAGRGGREPHLQPPRTPPSHEKPPVAPPHPRGQNSFLPKAAVIARPAGIQGIHRMIGGNF